MTSLNGNLLGRSANGENYYYICLGIAGNCQQ